MSDINSWIPAVSTTSLLVLAMWLLRSLISTRLTKSVENEFNKKLESLKAELRAKEAQIDALRSGAMSGLINRQSKLYERQLESIEQVWEAVAELGKAKFVSQTMAIIKFEESAKEAAVNPKFRQVIELMGGGFNLKDIKLGAATKARPFLSPLAWAYYSAYQSIIILAAMKHEALKIGLDGSDKYIDSGKVTDLIKTILPHQADYLDKYGSSAHHYLLDEIENLLLSELRNIQKGVDSDKENAERAAAILQESEKLMQSISNNTSKA